MIGSNVVFQAPDIMSGLIQRDQKRKAEQEIVKQKRESEVKAYDGEKLYYSTDMSKVNPKARPIVKNAFDIYKNFAVEYKVSGDEKVKTKMLEAYQQLNNILGAELAISENAATLAKKYQETGGKGFADTKEEFNRTMNLFGNPELNYSVENGRILIGDVTKGEKVDFTEHPRYSIEPNDFNRPSLNVIDPRSKFLDIDAIANDQYLSFKGSSGVLDRRADGDFYNSAVFAKKIESDLDSKLESRDFLESVYYRHAVLARKINTNTLDRDEVDAIMAEYDASPELKEAAVSSFKKNIVDKSVDRLNADKPRPTPAPKKPTLAETFWSDPKSIARSKVTEQPNGGFHIELNQKGLALPRYSGSDAYIITRVVLDKQGKVTKFMGIKKNKNEDFMAMANRYADQEALSSVSSDEEYFDKNIIKDLQEFLNEKNVTGEILSMYGKGKDGKATTTSLPPITAAQRKALEAEASKKK